MSGWFEKNLKILSARFPLIGEPLAALTIEPGVFIAQDGGRAFWGPDDQGHMVLSWAAGANDIPRRLTSANGAEKEDQALAAKAGLGAQTFVMAAGFGLGYYLEMVLALAPKARLTVYEARPELLAAALAARDLSDLLNHPNLNGLEVGSPVSDFSGGLGPNGLHLARPANMRLMGHLYPAVFRPAGLKRRPLKKVLFLENGYYLNREILAAGQTAGLVIEGHQTARHEEGDGQGRAEDFKALLNRIASFKPDLVLTVNHFGFDDQGLFTDALKRLGLRAASWFVDSPLFILGQDRANVSPLVSVFSWDEDYLDILKRQGFTNVHYLPLASDEHFFKPAAGLCARRAAAFVGDSLNWICQKYLKRLGLSADKLSAADEAAKVFVGRPQVEPGRDFLLPLARLCGLNEHKQQVINDLAALVTWRASRLKRISMLEGWPGLEIVGDRGWQDSLPQARLSPPIDYYSGLSAFYQTTSVNLNITSAQMKGGLNQRVFDAPLAGGFLLTDDQKQLGGLFEPGREVVVYQNRQEAEELTAWYLKNETARLEIIEAARRRILKEHLYHHRLETLIKAVSCAS